MNRYVWRQLRSLTTSFLYSPRRSSNAIKEPQTGNWLSTWTRSEQGRYCWMRRLDIGRESLHSTQVRRSGESLVYSLHFTQVRRCGDHGYKIEVVTIIQLNNSLKQSLVIVYPWQLLLYPSCILMTSQSLTIIRQGASLVSAVLSGLLVLSLYHNCDSTTIRLPRKIDVFIFCLRRIRSRRAIRRSRIAIVIAALERVMLSCLLQHLSRRKQQESLADAKVSARQQCVYEGH